MKYLLFNFLYKKVDLESIMFLVGINLNNLHLFELKKSKTHRSSLLQAEKHSYLVNTVSNEM